MKRAIVFGATGGIGQAICQDLAEDGWSLYLHYNSKKQEAEKLAQKLYNAYPVQDFMTVQLNFDSSDKVLTDFVKNLLPVNAAVFAQGITDYGFLYDEKLEKINKLIDVITAQYDLICESWLKYFNAKQIQFYI